MRPEVRRAPIARQRAPQYPAPDGDDRVGCDPTPPDRETVATIAALVCQMRTQPVPGEDPCVAVESAGLLLKGWVRIPPCGEEAASGDGDGDEPLDHPFGPEGPTIACPAQGACLQADRKRFVSAQPTCGSSSTLRLVRTAPTVSPTDPSAAAGPCPRRRRRALLRGDRSAGRPSHGRPAPPRPSSGRN